MSPLEQQLSLPGIVFVRVVIAIIGEYGGHFYQIHGVRCTKNNTTP